MAAEPNRIAPTNDAVSLVALTALTTPKKLENATPSHDKVIVVKTALTRTASPHLRRFGTSEKESLCR